MSIPAVDCISQSSRGPHSDQYVLTCSLRSDDESVEMGTETVRNSVGVIVEDLPDSF